PRGPRRVLATARPHRSAQHVKPLPVRPVLSQRQDFRLARLARREERAHRRLRARGEVPDPLGLRQILMRHPSELLPPQDYAAMAPRALTEPHAVAALPGALSHLNLAYATMIGWRPLRLDLHVPAGSPGPHPVVVYAHGGSFVGGIPALGP